VDLVRKECRLEQLLLILKGNEGLVCFRHHCGRENDIGRIFLYEVWWGLRVCVMIWIG